MATLFPPRPVPAPLNDPSPQASECGAGGPSLGLSLSGGSGGITGAAEPLAAPTLLVPTGLAMARVPSLGSPEARVPSLGGPEAAELRGVRFCSPTNTEHPITPYSEVYGAHPSTFNFSSFGMVPPSPVACHPVVVSSPSSPVTGAAATTVLQAPPSGYIVGTPCSSLTYRQCGTRLPVAHQGAHTPPQPLAPPSAALVSPRLPTTLSAHTLSVPAAATAPCGLPALSSTSSVATPRAWPGGGGGLTTGINAVVQPAAQHVQTKLYRSGTSASTPVLPGSASSLAGLPTWQSVNAPVASLSRLPLQTVVMTPYVR